MKPFCHENFSKTWPIIASKMLESAYTSLRFFPSTRTHLFETELLSFGHPILK